ncbi:amino acid ABC transporter ATP-binding protein [Dactylosporangium sp. NPDC000555]|uniref:amino acid ABC transporter ATP-binding protein n=1 Tax=Dactylosporangium sp. NPDC000555 TaxID=3154260 RepID=UPI00332E4FFF
MAQPDINGLIRRGDASRPAEPKPESVRFQAVSKSFSTRLVLDDLSLTVRTGEKVALIGPSGSGKTTVLRIVAGLEEPDAGQVAVFGQQVWPYRRPRPWRRGDARDRDRTMRHVGMVFQHFNLFPHMRVLANITEGPIRSRGIGREAARAKALELLEMVGLSGFADAWPANLSGGQQQRVAIARALAMEPRLVLLDEVTSALDPELVGEVLAVIRDISQASDLTILMVTHEMSFAARSVDRVLMFDEGQVVEDGPAAQVLREPAHERTKRFLSAVVER